MDRRVIKKLKAEIGLGSVAFGIGMALILPVTILVVYVIRMADAGSTIAQFMLLAVGMMVALAMVFTFMIGSRWIDVKAMLAMAETNIRSQEVNAMENVALSQRQSHQQPQQRQLPAGSPQWTVQQPAGNDYLLVDPELVNPRE